MCDAKVWYCDIFLIVVAHGSLVMGLAAVRPFSFIRALDVFVGFVLCLVIAVGVCGIALTLSLLFILVYLCG